MNDGGDCRTAPATPGLLIILLKLFFLQNFWSCPQVYREADRRQKSPLDGATDFLATIWHHITTVSFL